MIYVIGDLHGDFSALWKFAKQEPGRAWTKQDFVIVMGDFGVWPHTLAKIGELARLPFTVLFLDGNHEDFSLLNAMPQTEKFGGRVHDLGGVYHLMRAEVFDLPCERGCIRVAVCGGGESRDKERRTPGVDWFVQESIDAAQVQGLRQRMQEAGGRVDYFLSHVMSSALKAERTYASHAPAGAAAQAIFPSEYKVRDMIGFIHAKAYVCGHEHIDATFTLQGKRFLAVYKNFVLLD